MKVKSEHRRPGKSRMKLSKNLLLMKFMKKSKEDQENQEEQEDYARIFESSQSVAESGCKVSYQPDLAIIERLVFPHRSYGGFNETLESLMVEQDGSAGASGAPVVVKPDPELEVSDVSMAACLSRTAGPAATMFRKFNTKRQRAQTPGQQQHQRNPIPPPPASTGGHPEHQPPTSKRTARGFMKPQFD